MPTSEVFVSIRNWTWIKSSVTLVIDKMAISIVIKCLYVYFTLNSGAVPDKAMQPTGVYDLVAVLTHKGRSADSGHYVAWVKQESGNFLSQLPEIKNVK